MDNHELSKNIYEQVLAGDAKTRKMYMHYETCIEYGSCYREYELTLKDGSRYFLLSNLGFFGDWYCLQRHDQEKEMYMGKTEYYAKKIFKLITRD